MSDATKKDRRWLKSVIAASAEPLPNFPWMRGERRRPQAMTEMADDATAPTVVSAAAIPHVAPRRVTLAAR